MASPKVVYFLLLLILVVSNGDIMVSSTRFGRANFKDKDLHSRKYILPKMKKTTRVKAFKFDFSLLPKGTPIPPSGPSHRENGHSPKGSD